VVERDGLLKRPALFVLIDFQVFCLRYVLLIRAEIPHCSAESSKSPAAQQLPGGSRTGHNDMIRAIQPEVAPRELLKYWILEPCLREALSSSFFVYRSASHRHSIKTLFPESSGCQQDRYGVRLPEMVVQHIRRQS
jgi:hypothetical protein